jgi:hypothetical protein
MKKLLLTAAAVLATLNMYAQGPYIGTVNFNATGVPDNFRVWINDSGLAGDGQRAGANPAGQTENGYMVALWWGYPNETDENRMTQIGGKTALLGTTGGASTSPAGTWFGGSRTITYNHTAADPSANPPYPGTTGPGAVLSFQVRGWTGTTTDARTYQSVKDSNNPLLRVGESPIFNLKTKDEGNTLETRPNIWSGVGYSGFGLTPVPEPSVIALGLLGAGALLMLRRRK